MVSVHSGSCRRKARTKSIRRSILLFLAKRPIDKIDFWKVLDDASSNFATFAPFSIQTIPFGRTGLNRSKSDALTAAMPA